MKIPVPEITYYEGETLQLFPGSPPDPPTDTRCYYSQRSRPLPEIMDRYNKSVKERITPPSNSPDLSIVLEKRLNSSTDRISHVWLAQVQHSSRGTYPQLLVAKIYDPVFFSEAKHCDPFKLRNHSVSQEVKSYHQLEQLQGTKVPRYYGHFITALPSQQNRTVNVILMENILGHDLRSLVRPIAVDNVCAMHKSTVIEAVMNLVIDLDIQGLRHLDMQPRNVLLVSPKERREFCPEAWCPLRLKADCEDLRVVMIDFGDVEFRNSVWIHWNRQEVIEDEKPTMLADWLEGRTNL